MKTSGPNKNKELYNLVKVMKVSILSH